MLMSFSSFFLQNLYTFEQLIEDVDNIPKPSKTWFIFKFEKLVLFMEILPNIFCERKKIIITDSMKVKYYYKIKPITWLESGEISSIKDVKRVIDLYDFLVFPENLID